MASWEAIHQSSGLHCVATTRPRESRAEALSVWWAQGVRSSRGQD